MRFKRIVAKVTGIACLVSLSLPTGACGFIFSHAPPQGHEQMEYFSCTESNAGPIIDVIWAVLNVLGAIAIAGDPDAYENPNAYIASGLAWGVFSSVAAGVGFNKSKKCSMAKRQLAARQRAGPVAPGPTTVQAVVITPAADTLTVGQRRQLTAAAHSSSGATLPDKVFAWSSSNDAIASVSSAGLVTAHASGTVVIAARTENVVGIANIVVIPAR